MNSKPKARGPPPAVVKLSSAQVLYRLEQLFSRIILNPGIKQYVDANGIEKECDINPLVQIMRHLNIDVSNKSSSTYLTRTWKEQVDDPSLSFKWDLLRQQDSCTAKFPMLSLHTSSAIITQYGGDHENMISILLADCQKLGLKKPRRDLAFISLVAAQSIQGWQKGETTRNILRSAISLCFANRGIVGQLFDCQATENDHFVIKQIFKDDAVSAYLHKNFVLVKNMVLSSTPLKLKGGLLFFAPLDLKNEIDEIIKHAESEYSKIELAAALNRVHISQDKMKGLLAQNEELQKEIRSAQTEFGEHMAHLTQLMNNQ